MRKFSIQSTMMTTWLSQKGNPSTKKQSITYICMIHIEIRLNSTPNKQSKTMWNRLNKMLSSFFRILLTATLNFVRFNITIQWASSLQKEKKHFWMKYLLRFVMTHRNQLMWLIGQKNSTNQRSLAKVQKKSCKK